MAEKLTAPRGDDLKDSQEEINKLKAQHKDEIDEMKVSATNPIRVILYSVHPFQVLVYIELSSKHEGTCT